jgi:hypothetical protein
MTQILLKFKTLADSRTNSRPFVPQNITTEDDLISWLQLTFPMAKNSDLAKILLVSRP